MGVLNQISYSTEELASFVSFPKPDANKYTRGKVIVFAGSMSYPGAAILACRAAQRMGAGYVQLLTREGIVRDLQVAMPSVVVCPVEPLINSAMQNRTDAFGNDFFSYDKPCAYLLGPGFNSVDDICSEVTKMVLKNAKASVVVDGGALGVLSTFDGAKDILSQRANNGFATLFTPHMGEATKLLGNTKEQLNDGLCEELSYEQVSATIAKKYFATILLKGPKSYVCDTSSIYVMKNGSAALAKAGTGDVLSGMIAGLLCQGVNVFQAACLGAEVHALAGVLAACKLGEISVIAEDVLDHISCSLHKLCG